MVLYWRGMIFGEVIRKSLGRMHLSVHGLGYVVCRSFTWVHFDTVTHSTSAKAILASTCKERIANIPQCHHTSSCKSWIQKISAALPELEKCRTPRTAEPLRKRTHRGTSGYGSCILRRTVWILYKRGPK